MTYDVVTSRDATANGGSQQQRRHKIFSDLTNEEEEMMVKWIRETDCLYNKKRIDYRDFPAKDKLWADKAKEMGKKGDYKIKMRFLFLPLNVIPLCLY